MTLTPGSRLGAYEIAAQLGAGGMGEVYRATDTKLKRQVALKVLPESVAQDEERLARFQREAGALAQLNHPNVVTIYSVERLDGVDFLTMELVEGTTLADLIPRGGLPLETALGILLQLADAMSAAHGRSVIHRDLKPANVIVSAEGRVKILDFGLAKIWHDAAAVVDESLVTTVQVTRPFSVLGTPSYMSPEQAEGRSVDARSDIFALGVIAYEMLAGARPFRGSSPMAVVSSLLKDQPPPLARSRAEVPEALSRIVERCLEKEPDRRYQTAKELRDDLERLRSGTAATAARPSPPAARLTLRTAVLPASAVALVAVVAWFWNTAGQPEDSPPQATFARVTTQPGAELGPSLSRDGRWVVYAGESATDRDIYLQSTSGQTPINLTPNTPSDDEQPAFSPDDERIAFRSSRDGGGIFVMGRTGEAVRRVTREGFNPAWSPDGSMMAYTTSRTDVRPQNAEQRGRLMVVALEGGGPRQLHEAAMLPSWSPRGIRIAFSGRIAGRNAGSTNIATVPIGGGDPVSVTDDAFLNWNPVWAPDGRHLFFVSDRGGTTNIWRVGIDEASGRPLGEPEPLASPTAFAAHVSIAGDGSTLAYSEVQESQNLYRLPFDPDKAEVSGPPQAVTTGSRFWSSPDPSPDGRSIVFYSQVGPEGDLYVGPADGEGTPRQLTDDMPLDRVPRWSPRGDRIAMFSDRSGELQVWTIRPDGSELRMITDVGSSVVAWSPDGTELAVTRDLTNAERGRASAVLIGLGSDGSPARVVDLPPPPAPYLSFGPNSWSPDGRWLAGQYGFTTLGVAVYSLAQRSYQRLTDVGEWPVWLPDSQRLLFVSRGREFQVVDLRTRMVKTVFSVARDTLGPPRLAPDGRSLYFSRRTTEADVWLARLR